MLVAFISRKLECKWKCFLCALFIRASLSKTESKINVVSKLLLRQRSRIQFAPYWYIIKYWSVSSRKTVVLPQASQVHSESLSETINWNSRGKTSRKTSNCRKPKNTSIFFTILMPFICFIGTGSSWIVVGFLCRFQSRTHGVWNVGGIFLLAAIANSKSP